MSDCEDCVHPIDRRLHEILAYIAETTRDPRLRRVALDLQLTLPSVVGWSDKQLLAVYERFTVLSQRGRLTPASPPPSL